VAPNLFLFGLRFMRIFFGRIFRLLLSLLSVALVIGLLAAGWFYLRLRASRPLLDGGVNVSGLVAGVSIERDGAGVPTIRGSSRLDVARALGWLHAQERFFQMDLLRRRAAGELAELVGAAALPSDKATRIHGFRAVARLAMERASPAERALAEAYAAGVNAGLGALGTKPFEYVLLRATPDPWRAEDCGLVGFSMTLDMQNDVVDHERAIANLRNTLGAEALAFFASPTGPLDAALDGSSAPLPKFPSVQSINLRKTPADAAAKVSALSFERTESEHRGSNAFALAGAHTASGAGMLANDMHLSLSLPNTWFRAALIWPEGGIERRVVGLTFPGVPFVVAGSNGRVAWGFTNSPTDASDLIVVQTGISPEVYRAPNRDPMPQIEVRKETILVKGAAPLVVEYRWTIWGPIVGADEKGRPLAQRWTAHDPEAQNFGLWQMETAENTAAAVAIAHRAGVTPLNFHVADLSGEIAWTVAGRLPKRVGYDGRWPVTWTFGDRRWDGFIAPDDMPTVIAPASGRNWTANARAIGGVGGSLLGESGFAEPMRAAQIRDALMKVERATPKDLLSIQLDDRAIALGRWRDLLLQTLDSTATVGQKDRAEVRAQVEKWNARASVDSVGYRLVRAWRDAVARRVLDPIFAPCLEEDRSFRWTRLNYEEPLWVLLAEKPMHLLSPKEASWEALRVGAVDDVLTDLAKTGTPVSGATWGRRNIVRIQHPLSRVLPAFLTDWMNLPDEPLPGDSNMPRLQTPRLGASERFVVSPGREAEGIFHMPGGQSGHPLSPFYRAGHEAWVRGEPTPFLPGKTEHTVTLRP
jgi:penicillin amidase